MQHKVSTPAAGISVIASIAPIASRKDAWLVDIWGVMHNGVRPFLPAAEACAKFRAAGGTVILLSNAPRPAASVAAQLHRIGVPREAWDMIITSGDAARALIAAFGPKPIYHLGPERDLGVYDGLSVTMTSAEMAEAIVCTGLFDDETETPETYAESLAALAKRKLPMVCVNPDITVERGGRIIYCAGALAEAYERLGGEVAYAGKPYLPVYDMTAKALAGMRGQAVPRDKQLAIGDGVRTDIAGAAAAGIESVYVASPVHIASAAGLGDKELLSLFPDPAVRPIAAMRALAW